MRGRLQLSTWAVHAYNFCVVPSQHPELDRVCDQVEQLLNRHDLLQQKHATLQQQVNALQDERTHLQQRIEAACGRIDALLTGLPEAELPAPPPFISMPR